MLIEKKIKKLKDLFVELFDNHSFNNSYISIKNSGDEIVLKANQEGIVLLIEELIDLCESNIVGKHYHLDEAGIINKCDIPIIISYSNDKL